MPGDVIGCFYYAESVDNSSEGIYFVGGEIDQVAGGVSQVCR